MRLSLVILCLFVVSCDEINQDISNKDLSPEAIIRPEKSKVNPEEHYCLSLNIYHEARNDNLAGMVATADVVLNRVNDTRYPNDVCSVIFQSQTWVSGIPVRNKCQFSWYCDGKPDTITNWKSFNKIKKLMFTLRQGTKV